VVKLLIQAGGRGREYPLKEGVCLIGRDLSCDVTVLNKSLSRRHLECTIRGDTVSIRDLGSRNGTYVNERRVQDAALSAGDVVRAGQVVMRFVVAAEAAPVPPAPAAEADELAAAVPKSDQYEEDDQPTPTDEGFAPEVAASEQTRLVTRDGKWFVQDEESGAAVEIVPARRAVAVEAESIEAKPPRTSLLDALSKKVRIALVSLLALVVLLVAALVMRKPGNTPPGRLSRRAYTRQVERAAVAYDKDQVRDAIALLESVKNLKTADAPATDAILMEAIQRDQLLKKDFAAHWEAADKKWEELANYSKVTPAVGKLAQDRLRTVREETSNLFIYNDLLRLYEGAHTSGDWSKFLARARSLKATSMFRPLLEDRIEEATKKCIAQCLQDADQAESRRRWADARKLYETLAQMSPVLADQMKARIARVQSFMAHQRLLRQATDLIPAGKGDEALALLDGIPASSPYAREADTLRLRARKVDTVAKAQAAYDRGKGKEALTILEGAGLNRDALYVRITLVLGHWQGAQDMLLHGKFPEAQAACSELIRVETSTTNWYHGQAQQTLRSLPQQRVRLARERLAVGDAFYRKGQYRDARKAYEAAHSLDPNNKMGVGQLNGMKSEAVKKLNLAKNTPDRAVEIQLLREAADMVPPDHRLFREARERLHELGADVKADQGN